MHGYEVWHNENTTAVQVKCLQQAGQIVVYGITGGTTHTKLLSHHGEP